MCRLLVEAVDAGEEEEDWNSRQEAWWRPYIDEREKVLKSSILPAEPCGSIPQRQPDPPGSQRQRVAIFESHDGPTDRAVGSQPPPVRKDDIRPGGLHEREQRMSLPVPAEKEDGHPCMPCAFRLGSFPTGPGSIHPSIHPSILPSNSQGCQGFPPPSPTLN